MKLVYILSILLIFNNCSFDQKSGIWKNENKIYDDKENIVFKDFKKINTSIDFFNEIIPINSNYNFTIDEPLINKSWNDIFYKKNNNTINFKYDNLNQIVFKTKRLANNQVNDFLLFENKNLIINDIKGNIIIYSINNNSEVKRFNFYKKKYKKLKKSLNLIVDDNIIYISDNIGYIYSYNYKYDKILWAKKFKIPFRSNIKLFSNKLVTSNQNNDLLILDKESGNLIKLIPSEETAFNNQFENNIALSDRDIFFLNTYGSLYSINKNNFKINWFINLNKSLDLNLTNLFYGSNIVSYSNKILLSSNENFYILDNKTGSILKKKNFSSNFKPIIINDYIFLITKNNLLIAMELQNGKIIYSYDIAEKVAKFINTKKKNLNIKSFIFANNKVFVFLKNSYVIEFEINGEITEVTKLPSNLKSQPIIIDNYLLYLNKKKKLVSVN
tara:strand:- start:3327 stop:4655 length:1329 start_codon:yes stop_codon:yes gene_type:complete